MDFVIVSFRFSDETWDTADWDVFTNWKEAEEHIKAMQEYAPIVEVRTWYVRAQGEPTIRWNRKSTGEWVSNY